MDLRDRFASSFAQALVTQGALLGSSELAHRAYELAEAMLSERARRIAEDERNAFDDEPGAFDDEGVGPSSVHLLDDAPAAPDDDAREEALAAWLEARAADEADEGPTSKAPRSSGPGLAKARAPEPSSKPSDGKTGT